MVLWLTLAFGSTVDVPVQGTLYDPQGAPLEGGRTARLRLYADSAGAVPVHTTDVTLQFSSGGFATTLDDVPVAALRDNGDLWFGLQVDGVEARVPVGWAARAGYAAAAGDAQQLGGLDASTYATAASVTAVAGGLSTANGNIAGLTSGLSTANGDIAGLTSGLSTANGDIAGLTSGLSTANGNISALTTSLATTNGNVTALQTAAVDGARLTNGTVTTAKLASNAVTGAAYTPGGSIAASTVGGAVAELDAEKADVRDIPLGPNFLQDTRVFTKLARTSGGVEVWDSWTELSYAASPWGWTDYTQGQATISRARVRKVRAETLRASPGSWPELATASTLLAAQSDSWTAPSYTDYAVADFDIQASTSVTNGRTIAFMRQGCPRQGGAYTSKFRVSTQMFVKVIAIPANMELSVASNGWPSQSFTAPTSDWTYVNRTNDTTGGCIDVFNVYCTNACNGNIRFAIALPYISTGRRSGFAWAGYAGWMTDDVP